MTKITLSKQLFTEVFDCDQWPDRTLQQMESDVTIRAVETFIDSRIDKSVKEEPKDSQPGRLGPSQVIWDVCSNGHVGSLVIESDRLSVLSHSGFSSIKANVCAFQGKWQYEIMLNSKGVMQMGWSTKGCHFSQEKGVGDTNDSYAYDGNRIRKWNVSTSKYGQSWQIGDCITSTIDLDIGTIDFYRNGHHLGTAFDNIRMGKSFAYFPAISLAYQESVVANFGSTPFKFPIKGYQPLERVSNDFIRTGSLISQWVCNLVTIDSHRELSISQYLICNKILTKFSHIFCHKYIIEECFQRTLFRLTSDSIHAIMALMWTLMEGQQIHDFLESLMRSIVNNYRFSTISLSNGGKTLNLEHQKQCLSVVLSLVTEPQTRRYLVNHILFESKFQLILDIKSLEDESLTSVLLSDISLETILSEDNITFMKDIRIESAIKEIESLQEQILSALLFQDDITRSSFVKKFENFAKDSLASNSRSQNQQMVANMCPIILSVFQRLSHVIRNHLKDSINFIGVTYFADNVVNNDSTRIGGTASYLQKQNRDDLSRYLEESISLSPLMKDMYSLIDNLVKVYPMGAHRHLAKLCSVSDQLDEYIKTYKELKERFPLETKNQPKTRQTLSVLEDKIVSFGRQLVLINSIELNQSKKESIYWLLRLVINTLQHSSSCGHLFSFIPDYFIETLISLFSSIRFYFVIPSEESSLTSKREYESLLQQFSSFIASHFCDQRITIADIRDNLSQALASLVSNSETLKALESISFDGRIKLVKSLCRPYENRAWAQTNWTLLRFWKGSGFGYRYAKPPNTINRLGYPTNKDQNSLNHLSPNPSLLYQSLIGEYLKSDPECAIAFISSLLSQLNWTFSEFIGMLQEIQNSVNRPQKVFIDSRQLKICSTCFELTLALLRVLEMIVSVNPELITLSPPNQLISVQFTQILCQILNRLTITGCFDFVICLDIQELESISHFQILSAGILVALTTRGSESSREEAFRTITSEPSFLNESLLFLIGENSKSDPNGKPFSLTDFDELTAEEKSALKQMIASLTSDGNVVNSNENQESTDCQQIPDDQICTICYANRKVALFPCGHKSCRSCIAIHFLRNGEKCFFCKAVIERVVFDDSDEILYPKKAI